jgi:hypothetical protein
VNLLHDAHTTVRVAAWCYDQVERGHGIVWIARGQTRKLDGSWRAALRQ